MPKVEANGEELFNLAISIVGLVLREGAASVSELAEHFGVSTRSIERAVMAISLAEDQRRFVSFFELDWDAWDGGEVSFRALGNLTSAPPVTRAQSAALATALGYLASLPEFANNPDLAELQRALGEIPPAQLPTTSLPRHLESLQPAIGRQQLRLSYLNQVGEASERTVDPLRIDLINNQHYLRAWCHHSAALRTFRLDRIVAVEILDSALSDAAAKVVLGDELFADDTGHRVTVLAKPWAREIFWKFPVTAPAQKQADGSWLGEIQIANLQALGRHVSRYGGAVKVIAPETARAAVADFALAAMTEIEAE